MLNIKPTPPLTVTYYSKSIPLQLPKDLTLRSCDLKSVPKTSFTHNQIQTVFNEIVWTQRKENIEQQYKINTDNNGVCLLLAELMVRELSDRNCPTIKVSLTYKPHSYKWAYHIAAAMLDSKFYSAKDLGEHLWVFEPWFSPGMKLLNFKDWLKLHFAESAVVDISPNTVISPCLWGTSLSLYQHWDFGNILKYVREYRNIWTSLEATFTTLHSTFKTRTLWLQEQERLLYYCLPHTLPLYAKKTMAEYLGVVNFSVHELNTLDLQENIEFLSMVPKLSASDVIFLAAYISTLSESYQEKIFNAIYHLFNGDKNAYRVGSELVKIPSFVSHLIETSSGLIPTRNQWLARAIFTQFIQSRVLVLVQ